VRVGAEARTGAVPRLTVPNYDASVKQINCVCGIVLKGASDDELWAAAQEHIRTDHPDLVGKVSRDDIVAQAEEI
jgi:predicted small metal-binding protein